MKFAPDLVWVVDGEVRACIDMKYKVEKHGQYPNADLYQMAAYCRRFGLGEGWLIYAAGDADVHRTSVIDGPTIRRLAVNLDRSTESLPDQLSIHVRDQLVTGAASARFSADGSRSPGRDGRTASV